MPEFYDKQGSAISRGEYARLKMEDPAYGKVAQDQVQGWLVSTVWLGIDHSLTFSLSKPSAHIPIIFETMVFPPESYSDEYCERYATEKAALAGHQKALGWLLDKLGPEAIDYIDYEDNISSEAAGAHQDSFEDLKALANLILLQEIGKEIA